MTNQNEEFKALVQRYIRNQDDAHARNYVLNPKLVERTHDTLLTIKRDVETQFAQRKLSILQQQYELDNEISEDIITEVEADERETKLREEKAKDAQWKIKSLTFLNSIESCLVEVKAVIRETRTEVEEVTTG